MLLDSTGEEDSEEATSCPVHNKPANFGKKLTDERAAQLAVGSVLGGYDNVAVTLGYLSYLLATNPDIQEKLQAEIDDYFVNKPVCILFEL